MFSKLINNFLHRLDVKLTIYYTLIVLFISSAVCVFFIYSLQRSLMKQVDSLIRDEVHELVYEHEEEADIIRACTGYEEDSSNREYFPMVFRLIDSSGKVFYASQNTSKISFPAPANKPSHFFTLKMPNRKYPFRLYETKLTVDNFSDFTLQIATETKQNEKIIENLYDNILIAVVVVLFLSIGCGIFASRKPRKIIQDVTKVAKRITSQNLSERLLTPATHDEIYDLTVTINSMMDRLETSFKEIKQFTSDVSHELRNPLFALKGEMEVALSQKRKDEEYREVISECLERCDFLIKAVNDLFLISRFDMKKIDLDLTYLNLCEVLKDLFDFHLPMAEEKNLSFTIGRCDDVLVNGDKTRIHQLFSNLMDNAIKFTPENGSVALSLIVKNNTAQFIVEDNGIGISEADIHHIFNRFYQVDKSRSGLYRGSGLGLNISKKIAEAHGGDITVKQNENKGVTFVVALPKA